MGSLHTFRVLGLKKCVTLQHTFWPLWVETQPPAQIQLSRSSALLASKPRTTSSKRSSPSSAERTGKPLLLKVTPNLLLCQPMEVLLQLLLAKLLLLPLLLPRPRRKRRKKNLKKKMMTWDSVSLTNSTHFCILFVRNKLMKCQKKKSQILIENMQIHAKMREGDKITW